MSKNKSEVVITGDINNSFIDALQQFRSGESIHELSEGLQKLVLAVMDREKKGSITYTLTIHPRGNAVILTDKIDVKLPEEKREEKVFFANDDGTIQMQNPAQRNLEFKEVKKEPAPGVVDITEQTKAVSS